MNSEKVMQQRTTCRREARLAFGLLGNREERTANGRECANRDVSPLAFVHCIVMMNDFAYNCCRMQEDTSLVWMRARGAWIALQDQR
jgi:hypothetical protein